MSLIQRERLLLSVNLFVLLVRGCVWGGDCFDLGLKAK